MLEKTTFFNANIYQKKHFVDVILPTCRNYAIKVSKSKYISFVDSDSSCLSDKLEKQITFMEKHNLSFTCTAYTPFFESFGKFN